MADLGLDHNGVACRGRTGALVGKAIPIALENAQMNYLSTLVDSWIGTLIAFVRYCISICTHIYSKSRFRSVFVLTARHRMDPNGRFLVSLPVAFDPFTD